MVQLNVLSCTYNLCKESAKDNRDIDIMHRPLIVCIPARLVEFGTFPVSTLTMLFQDEESSPIRITERVYKKDCKRLEYWRYLRLMRIKIKTIQYEYGYELEFVQTHDYFDFTHTKEDLLSWAINNIQLVQS